MNYGYDIIDGKKIAHTVIENDYKLERKHIGTVHVVNCELIIYGELHGTLDVQQNAKVIIEGKQHGSTYIDNDAQIVINGELHGSTYVKSNGVITIENAGKMMGSLNNHGTVVVKGVFSGSQTGSGSLLLKGNGYIKQPIVRNGINYYEL